MRKHHSRMGIAFHMALLCFGDGNFNLKQILKCLLRREATSQRQTLFGSIRQELKATA